MGLGIDPKQSNNVFKIFKRLHSNEEYDGTGIGLAITKRIIERHEGNIWVESELGKGSTLLLHIYPIIIIKNFYFLEANLLVIIVFALRRS